MSLPIEKVRQLSQLARIGISVDDEVRLGEQLGRILDYMAKLDEVDVTGVAPMLHPFPANQPERADVALPGLTPEEALAQAPQPVAGGFGVPRIIE